MISKIELKSFRSFNSLKLEVSNSLVILCGKNATGKTSVLEALYLCSTTKSHRTVDLSTVIQKDKPMASVEVTADKKYKCLLSKEGKKVFINKSECKKTSEFIGNLSVVLYSPDDISLVKGSKSDKRKFMDMVLSTLDKRYLNQLVSYKQILANRNELLKNSKPDMKLLDVLTHQLAEFTEAIYLKRIQFIHRMNDLMNTIIDTLKTEKIRFVYNETYHPGEAYKSFKNREKSDLGFKSTGIGPHRDDFSVLINDLDASEYASEGQARLICIATKLALKEYIKEIKGIDPVLLLDDVFAALDHSRIESLVKYVKNSSQTFITATSILDIPDELLKDALVIRL